MIKEEEEEECGRERRRQKVRCWEKKKNLKKLRNGKGNQEVSSGGEGRNGEGNKGERMGGFWELNRVERERREKRGKETEFAQSQSKERDLFLGSRDLPAKKNPGKNP